MSAAAQCSEPLVPAPAHPPPPAADAAAPLPDHLPFSGSFCAAFLEELRDYSMKLHTKQQAPKEGKAAEPKQQKPVG